MNAYKQDKRFNPATGKFIRYGKWIIGGRSMSKSVIPSLMGNQRATVQMVNRLLDENTILIKNIELLGADISRLRSRLEFAGSDIENLEDSIAKLFNRK